MKILIATDGSAFSKGAVEKCAELIGERAETAKVISVFETPTPMAVEPFALSAEFYGHLEKIAKGRASDAVDSACSILRERCPNIVLDQSRSVELGLPAEVIVDEAQEWNADLIVMGSQGHGFWGRVFLGSVSDKVLHHAPCSVLIVRPNKTQQ